MKIAHSNNDVCFTNTTREQYGKPDGYISTYRCRDLIIDRLN